MYRKLIKPLLFRRNAILAHEIAARLLRLAEKTPLVRTLIRIGYKREYPALKKEVFGIEFPNPIGVAAGLDRNGEFYNVLSDFGAGFVEIGSISPEPITASDRKTKSVMIRIPGKKALISNFHFTNKGVHSAIKNLKDDKPDSIVIASITHNIHDHEESLVADYDKAFTLLYDFADIMEINISPATMGVGYDYGLAGLSEIMDPLMDKRMTMEVLKPVLLKISVGIPYEEMDKILLYAMRSGVDGIVAGDSIRNYTGLLGEKDGSIEGFVSGAPLLEKTISAIRHIVEFTKGRLPVVGCGGIMKPEDAKAMLDAGASLVEIYSGIIYEGPGLVKRTLNYLEENA